MGILYLKIFDNGKIYVGITNNFKRRMKEHEHKAFVENSNYPVHKAMRKHKYFNVVCTENIEDRELLNLLEIQTIQQLKEENVKLYNVTKGGEGILGLFGEKNHMFGKKLSKEHRKTLSLVNKGNKHAKGNKSFLGRNHTKETREKMSFSKKGKYLKEKNYWYGKKFTETHKSNLSKSKLENKEYYSNHSIRRGSFKRTCKRAGWDFNDFEEVFAEYFIRKDNYKEKKYFYFEKFSNKK